MYKKFRIAIICSLVVILISIAFPFAAFITDSFAIDGTQPYMSTSISTPVNGSTIKVGQCFTVTAIIRVSCPVSALNNDWLVKPVYAGGSDVSSAGAIISISGSATLGTGQNSQVSIADMLCNGQATVSWLVCCSGKGVTTITVTPFGSSYFLYDIRRSDNYVLVKLVTPVFATTTTPLPASHITSASVTVYQVEPASLLNDSAQPGSSGVQSGTWAQPANNRVTSAFVQQGQVLAGEPVRIMANVANKGDLPGSYTATLTINNQVEATKKVTVPGGASIPIEFTVTKDQPGNYEADINGQKVFFTVTGKQPASPFDAKIVVAIVIGVLILTVLVLLIRRLAAH